MPALRGWPKDAALEAAKQRADELLEAGDMDGCAVWKRVVAAIEYLQRDRPKSGEGVH